MNRTLVTKPTSYEDASPSLFNVRNEVEFTYNDFGQSIKTYQAHGGAVNTSSTPNVQMAYTDGTANRVRPTSLTYPNGRQVVFQYGPSAEIDAKASRIRNLRDSGVDLAQYAYLGENSVVQQTSPQADLEQTLISLTGSDDPDTGDIYAGLDRFGRIKDLRWRNTSSSTDLARREYGYDRDSNRLWSTDPVDTNSDHDWLLSYDGLQRLKDAYRGTLNSTHTGISTLDFAQCWTLDATNNWQNFRQNDDGSGGWDLVQQRTANTVNEITDITNSTGPTAITPTYDANGNMVTDRSGNHLLYDAWNRLMRVGDPSDDLLQRNDYDARGFLVRKRNYSGGVLSERFENYYTDSWQLIEVRPGTSTTVSEQNVWGLRYIDDLVLRDRDTTGNGTLDERLYCAQDANWNAIAVVDTSGGVQERYSYTPYGQVTFLSPSYAIRSSSDYAWTTLFTGRAWDPVSGFYHFRMREYDPVLGVFLTRDPLGYVGGMSRYASYFVPNGVDPSGLDRGFLPYMLSDIKRKMEQEDLCKIEMSMASGFHLLKWSGYPIPSYARDDWDKGCVGVTSCNVGKDPRDSESFSDCFANLEKAVDFQRELAAADNQCCPQIFAYTSHVGTAPRTDHNGKVDWGNKAVADLFQFFDFQFLDPNTGLWLGATAGTAYGGKFVIINPDCLADYNSGGKYTVYCVICKGDFTDFNPEKSTK